MPARLDESGVAHRPWPVPEGTWAISMRWFDLAFLHWPVAPQLLERHLPEGLELDTFEGSAWLGVVPFRMSGVRPRFTPAVPGVSTFPELNVRTYVVAGDKPGVWFFSLDVTKRLAVRAARTFFHLPYFRARMEVDRVGDTVHYSSRRSSREGEVAFEGSYGPDGPVELAVAGSLEHWLTERYCLYSADRAGRLYRGDVHHAPWPLQPARVTLERDTMDLPLGLPPRAEAPLAHFAAELDVVAWALRPVEARVPGR